MNLKGVVIFTLGAVAGGLATTLFWREKYRQKYKKEADDKVASMLEYVNRLREKEKNSGLSSQRQYTAQDSELGPDISEGGERPKRRDPRVRVNYHDYYPQTNDAEDALAESEYPREDDELTGDERHENKVKMKNENKERPRLVSASSFETEYIWFDKATLLYFTDDDMLVFEENNEPVDDEDQIVGDCLERFDFKTNNEKVVYVRNFARGTNYEVYKVYGAWEE